jgi:putative ABC transport system permease protein
MDTLVRDIRHALRVLAGNRGFALAALLTIALGVGGTTAVFSVVDGVLLRPLPYPDAGALVRLWEEHPGANAPLKGPLLSTQTYHAWKAAPATVEGVGAFRYGDSPVIAGDREGPEQRRVARVTPSVFGLLRVSPLVGRFFGDAEAGASAAPVAVLGEGFWRDRFAADPHVIGRTLTIDGVVHQIIGIAPPGFVFPARESGGPDPMRAVAVYTPLEVPPIDPSAKVIGITSAIARLRPGVTPLQAAAEGTSLARAVNRPLAELVYGRGGPVEVRARPIGEQMTARVRPALLVLAVGIVLVLCVACANVANLFLSRGADRARELAVRAALGADRRRLLQQLLTESLVLSLAGGGLGLLLGWMLTRAVPAVAPAGFPRLDDIQVNASFVLVALLAAVFVGTLSGILPALRGSRVDLAAVMQTSSGRTVGHASHGARRALLIVEAALAVVLLVGATLLGRSFETLLNVDAGYDRANVLTADISMPRGEQMFPSTQVLQRLRALPGVRAAGAGTMVPFGRTLDVSGFPLPGITGPDGKPLLARALQGIITPGYAEALGLRLQAGRFPRDDDATTPTINMIVNESFARTFLADGRGVVGRRFTGIFPNLLKRTDAVAEIVGLVADMLPDALDAQPQPQIYLPVGEAFTAQSPTLVVKTSGDPVAIAPLLRAIVREAEPSAAVDRVVALETKVVDSMGESRFAALVLGSFALLALILAVTGLYAVLAYHVAQRRRELGVRAALGATRPDLVWLILREGLIVTIAGLVAGLALAAIVTRAMGSLLFGVTPLDAVAFSAAPALLLIVAIIACLIPARRAATLDPARVLRAD